MTGVQTCALPIYVAGTPFAAFVPTSPWAYFSTYTTVPNGQIIPYGLLFPNFFSPGTQVYPGQPQHIGPGYDRAVFALLMGLGTIPGYSTFDYWETPVTWTIGVGHAQAFALPTSGEFAMANQRICPTSLIPALPLIAASGTTTRQLLATLVALPPSQANVTVDTYAAGSGDGNVNGQVTNLYYQNGSVYGDVTPNLSAQSPVSWFPIRVRSGEIGRAHV